MEDSLCDNEAQTGQTKEPKVSPELLLVAQHCLELDGILIGGADFAEDARGAMTLRLFWFRHDCVAGVCFEPWDPGYILV